MTGPGKVVAINAPRKKTRVQPRPPLLSWDEFAALHYAAGYKGQVAFWWQGPPLLPCEHCGDWYTRVAADWPPVPFCSVPCHDAARDEAKAVGA